MLSRHFSVCATTAKNIVVRDRFHFFTFYIRTDHSKNPDGGKIQEKSDGKGSGRCPHPPYSPDPSPYDLWFFGIAKEKMKDRQFRAVQDFLPRLAEICNDLTFEDVQYVFREWQIRLN
jgi:hypothetical protein